MNIDSVYLKPIDYDHIVNLFKKTIDHVIIKEESYYILVIHGSDMGYVSYNGKLVQFNEVANFVRQELNYPKLQHIDIRVCCCYGQAQKAYIDDKNYVSSMYANYKELICELHPSFCVFSYMN